MNGAIRLSDIPIVTVGWIPQLCGYVF
jgi:hypothetical protein